MQTRGVFKAAVQREVDNLFELFSSLDSSQGQQPVVSTEQAEQYLTIYNEQLKLLFQENTDDQAIITDNERAQMKQRLQQPYKDLNTAVSNFQYFAQSSPLSTQKEIGNTLLTIVTGVAVVAIIFAVGIPMLYMMFMHPLLVIAAMQSASASSAPWYPSLHVLAWSTASGGVIGSIFALPAICFRESRVRFFKSPAEITGQQAEKITNTIQSLFAAC